MVWIKRLVILVVILAVFGIVTISIFNEDMIEADLPVNVYEEDANLSNVVTLKMTELFTSATANKYTLVEEIVNLVILDSIRNNINASYDPLSDTCDTTECNFIIYEDNYYVNYMWAELNDDNQLVVHVSLGSEIAIGVNTIFDFTFDIGFDMLGFGINLTLDEYSVNDIGLSIKILDTIFSKIDTAQIENDVSTGTLDLEEYTYNISILGIS